jgi:hypothetical protein
MPEHERRTARTVYDHTEEEPVRRRRPVADWGVGEELFDGMPGRRFDRRGDDHRIPRGGVDDGRRTIVIADAHAPPEPHEHVDEYPSREEALRARDASEDHRAADGIVRGGVEGRRTVKIGGRPAQFHSAPARRRPVHERVGPRPDRIAAWAFALGILLILIAIATANI